MDIAERVRRIQGSERSQRKIAIPPGAIRMDQGDPAFPTPPHIQEAALKAMRENFTHYGNAFGEEDLREAICFILPLQKACVAAIRGPQDCVQQMVSKFDQRRKVAD